MQRLAGLAWYDIHRAELSKMLVECARCLDSESLHYDTTRTICEIPLLVAKASEHGPSLMDVARGDVFEFTDLAR